jgi:hypothetical protein
MSAGFPPAFPKASCRYECHELLRFEVIRCKVDWRFCQFGMQTWPKYDRHQLKGSLAAIVAAASGSALVAVTIYFSYNFSDRLAAVIGANGMNVILRLWAFRLVCIGVQILWNGASQLLTSLLLRQP